MTGFRGKASVALGKGLDYMPFLLLAAVGLALLTGNTDGPVMLAVLVVPTVLSVSIGVVVSQVR